MSTNVTRRPFCTQGSEGATFRAHKPDHQCAPPLSPPPPRRAAGRNRRSPPPAPCSAPIISSTPDEALSGGTVTALADARLASGELGTDVMGSLLSARTEAGEPLPRDVVLDNVLGASPSSRWS